MNEPHLQLLTVQQHILEEQRRHHPQASGEFSWLLSGITLATKIVASQVRLAAMAGCVAVRRDTNVHGDAAHVREVRIDVHSPTDATAVSTSVFIARSFTTNHWVRKYITPGNSPASATPSSIRMM